MDSISQFTLGAAVGEAVLGRKIGNHAIWAGGLCGTLPDLDIFFSGGNPITEVIQHRGISHSFFGIAVVTPLIAWLFFKWRAWMQGRTLSKGVASKYEDTTYLNWILFVFLALVTHPLLDAFTTYGTQLFLPFSNSRVAFNSVFVADPLYTIPFTICLIICMFFHRTNTKRRFWNNLGLYMSTGYIAFTVINKTIVNNIFKKSFTEQNIPVERYMSSPSPLNQILWTTAVETKEGYYIGSYSHLDDDKDVEYAYIAKDDTLRDVLSPLADYKTLQWFSNDYYMLTQRSDYIEYADLRFGPMKVYDVDRDAYKFVYKFQESADTFKVLPQDVKPDFEGGFSSYWNKFTDRVKGVEKSDLNKEE